MECLHVSSGTVVGSEETAVDKAMTALVELTYIYKLGGRLL